MNSCEVKYCEPWIHGKLLERLMAYKRRYPLFNVDRVMVEVANWPAKSQRWAPYMKDADIKKMNKSNARIKSWASQAAGQS